MKNDHMVSKERSEKEKQSTQPWRLWPLLCPRRNGCEYLGLNKLGLGPKIKVSVTAAGHDELSGTCSKQATLHIKLLKCTNKALFEEF